ncbi:uncharacterized protein LOC129600355 isoform X2 [Paramacrobiotus metropolitanus]|uniref:uncharacterized protein LOC129600355 isoform X2 n=1 Tax=Paramacrobiotus metropolitanus TaxID=2943436 RepID=UPI00244629CF|nr:uncharacterized protein LOC129600355 isoform X2 [Paramacrobiotus metropolitanus]
MWSVFYVCPHHRKSEFIAGYVPPSVTGLGRRDFHSCEGVNCGRNYVCQEIGAPRWWECRQRPAYPACYDRTDMIVPIEEDFGRESVGVMHIVQPACHSYCRSNADCQAPQICCMRNCDRVCYAEPEWTSSSN